MTELALKSMELQLQKIQTFLARMYAKDGK
jgi:hypothetical protein